MFTIRTEFEGHDAGVGCGGLDHDGCGSITEEDAGGTVGVINGVGDEF